MNIFSAAKVTEYLIGQWRIIHNFCCCSAGFGYKLRFPVNLPYAAVYVNLLSTKQIFLCAIQ